jgi:hypothetical protein
LAALCGFFGVGFDGTPVPQIFSFTAFPSWRTGTRVTGDSFSAGCFLWNRFFSSFRGVFLAEPNWVIPSAREPEEIGIEDEES